jgi:hypothetical protein
MLAHTKSAFQYGMSCSTRDCVAAVDAMQIQAEDAACQMTGKQLRCIRRILVRYPCTHGPISTSSHIPAAPQCLLAYTA